MAELIILVSFMAVFLAGAIPAAVVYAARRAKNRKEFWQYFNEF